MSAVTYHLTFPSNAQGLADAGASASIAFAYDGTEGNSAGEVKFTSTTDGLSAVSERGESSPVITWETLGVPVGATVTAVKCPTYDRKENADLGSSGSLALRITDGAQGGAVSVHGGSDLISHSISAGQADIVWATDTSGVSRSVTSSYQASNTPIRICLINTLTTGGGGGG